MIAVVAAAACEAEPVGPAPSPEPPPFTSTTASGSGAPSVAEPLDARRFHREPCQSLDGEQLAELGLGVRRPQQLASDLCQYFVIGGEDVVLDVMHMRTGLSYAYEAHARSAFRNWKPSVIGGYPAVSFQPGDEPSCSVNVGLSDSTRFYVLHEDPDCGTALRVAEEVLATVRGRG